MLASIIIPTHNRLEKTERAIRHILKQDNSENVEIIVVDDLSDIPFQSQLIREQDSVIRMEENVGAAVCRNKGMHAAKGELIYLLDSDDYFIKRDFSADLTAAKETRALLFCDHVIGNSPTVYSTKLTKESFFKQIFITEEGIGQTSTLCFLKMLNIEFDETLPKHQDWDLLYNCLFKADLPILKINGTVCLDKGDKLSISRQLTPQKSYIWLNKLNVDLPEDEYEWVKFNILAKFTSEYKWKVFFHKGIKYLYNKKYSMKLLIKRTLQRIILK